MKSLFAKLRISSALDNRQPLSSQLHQQLGRSEELRRYHETSAMLHDVLKTSAPAPKVPPALHYSIMRAIRGAENPAKQTPLLLRWSVTSVLLIALCLVAWRLTVRPANPIQPPLAAASTALDLSEQVAQDMPATVVAPLSDEWQRVNRDLENTAEFLLASLP